MRRSLPVGIGIAILATAEVAQAQSTPAGDTLLETRFEECRKAGDAVCMHRMLGEAMISPDHVAYCKSDTPEANEGCLITSVWFYCSALMAADVSSASEQHDIAQQGRATNRLVVEAYSDVSPVSTLPDDFYALADSLFDLIDAEACLETKDVACLRESGKKVAFADSLGAYQKYGARQCWPETGGVPVERVARIIEATGAN